MAQVVPLGLSCVLFLSIYNCCFGLVDVVGRFKGIRDIKHSDDMCIPSSPARLDQPVRIDFDHHVCGI